MRVQAVNLNQVAAAKKELESAIASLEAIIQRDQTTPGAVTTEVRNHAKNALAANQLAMTALNAT